MRCNLSGTKLFDACNLVVLGVIGVATLYPFLYILSLSLSTSAGAEGGGLHLLPWTFSLTAYRMVFSSPHIIAAYGNTLLRTVAGTGLTVVMTCLCAYPLSKSHLPFRRVWLWALMFTFVFHGGLVPSYLVIRNLGLIDNLWVYILPQLTNALSIFVMKNAFESIPESLGESAAIDGASEWQMLLHIYVPLCKPALATVALWSVVSHWNMWFDGMLYVHSEQRQILQMVLRNIVIENSTELVEYGLINPDLASFTPETVKAATIIVTILPVLFLYPWLQRYFTKGIMLGSTKG